MKCYACTGLCSLADQTLVRSLARDYSTGALRLAFLLLSHRFQIRPDEPLLEVLTGIAARLVPEPWKLAEVSSEVERAPVHARILEVDESDNAHFGIINDVVVLGVIVTENHRRLQFA